MKAKQILTFGVSMEVGVMEMKKYSSLRKSSEGEPHHQIKSYQEHSIFLLGGWEVCYTPLQRIRSAYYKPEWEECLISLQRIQSAYFKPSLWECLTPLQKIQSANCKPGLWGITNLFR